MDADQDLQEARARVLALEAAIQGNRASKKDLPDCPCWGNAPQWRDAELYAALDAAPEGEEPAGRARRLEAAVQRHREDGRTTPECSCWSTSARKADVKLYAVLGDAC